jgi:hypothetical protein
MAMFDDKSPFNPLSYLDNCKVDSIDLSIGGKGLCVSLEVKDDADADPDFIKKSLAEAMVEEILNRGLIDFTKQVNHYNFNTLYRARCYLLPDDNLRVLRINGVFNG